MIENEIGKIVVDCAYHVHQKLGPGLLESVYEVALAHEIKKRGPAVERQVAIPVVYDDGLERNRLTRRRGVAKGKALIRTDQSVHNLFRAIDCKNPGIRVIRLGGLRLGK